MSIETIGKRIASMRRDRGIRQEELANYAGVSIQAVSKWENGGTPDIELLPCIADFFGVSVDSLFGRSITDYSDLDSALIKKIVETPVEEQFKIVFDYCWNMERAFFGEMFPKDGSVEDYKKELDKNEQRYSSIISDHGFTRMGIANRQQYFLLVPENNDTQTAFFGNISDEDYMNFFKDFSDKNVFKACIMLNKRDSKKAFTPYLLTKNMKIEKTEAERVLNVLEKYHLLRKTQIETDDEVQTVYNFLPTPSFIALLIFAGEMIEPPECFSYYMAWRKKPYLK